MFFNKYPVVYEREKEDVKCSKIFRPWDNSDGKIKKASCSLKSLSAEADNCAQDATITTTTENEDNEAPSENSNAHSEGAIKHSAECSTGSPEQIKVAHRRCDKSFLSGRSAENSPQLVDYSGNPDAYPALYPDYVHLNLAHSLGLTPTDPLFLECVNQGSTLEEYTRVMSQEQHAKILSARKQRPKKYRCPHCNVGFSNNGQLKGHIRIHTGERPFRCDESNCGKTFTRNEELTRHKRIHSGLRPFPCTHCGKRFGRKDHLKKHSRTHFQPRGLYAVPVMLPFETWASSTGYPFVPMFTY